VKVREAGRIVSVAVIVTVGVNTDDLREVLGMDVRPSEAEPPHPEPVEGLDRLPTQARPTRPARRQSGDLRLPRGHQGGGLQGAHHVLAALSRPLHATAFAQDDARHAWAQWRRIADQLKPKVLKLAALMDEAEPDVLPYLSFPTQHRVKLYSTNLLERLNGEIKRRTDVAGTFPNEKAITRLVGTTCSIRTTNGPSSAPDTSRWKASLRRAMITSLGCQTSA
jgi:putative transposase